MENEHPVIAPCVVGARPFRDKPTWSRSPRTSERDCLRTAIAPVLFQDHCMNWKYGRRRRCSLG